MPEFSTPRLIIRAAKHSLSFLKPNADGTAERIPYTTKSGMSVAANLRTAVRELDVLANRDQRVLLSVCSPVSLIPVDEFMDDNMQEMSELYDYTFTGHEHDEKVRNVLPELNAIALYGVNKDLKLVANDHFADVRMQNLMMPVWMHLYRRSILSSQRRKLYCYFHDGIVDIFCFKQKRFAFANSFPVAHAHDALYFILFVWKQLAFNNEDDELHLVGAMVHHDWLMTKLKQFLRRVYTINPVADLNRAPISQIEGLEYDMMLN